MKKLKGMLVLLAGFLVAMAPFMTQSASACALGIYEPEMPDCLK